MVGPVGGWIGLAMADRRLTVSLMHLPAGNPEAFSQPYLGRKRCCQRSSLRGMSFMQKLNPHGVRFNYPALGINVKVVFPVRYGGSPTESRTLVLFDFGGIFM